MKDKTYGIDAEGELMKILNKQIFNSIRKDWRKMKIKSFIIGVWFNLILLKDRVLDTIKNN